MTAPGLRRVLAPLARLNQRRIENYYRATLTDHGLARAWTSHYLGGLGLNAGDRVLDFGCGRGRITARLVCQGLRTVGVDVAAQAWWKNIPEASFAVVSPEANRAPFLGSSFDAVLNIDSTHYYDPEQLGRHAADVWRMLRPGGHWVIVQANGEGYGASLARVRPPGRLHILDDVSRICEAAGFVPESKWFEGLAVPVFSSVYFRIRHLVAPWPLYMNDFGLPLSRLAPARRRHRWVLRLRKASN